MGHLQDALSRGYEELGFGRAAGGDEVFWQLVLARITEPVSKLDSLRVLEEAGIAPVSYATLRPPAGVRDRALAAQAVPRPAPCTPGWSGQPGALRRQHLVFRD
jgi:hypothetical protein